MLLHNLWIAWKSLRRSPLLSVLMVLCIAIGVAFALTFTATRHAFTKHPLPTQEGRLFYVRLDNWDPRAPYPGGSPDALPPQIARRDAVELHRSPIPSRRTASYRTRAFVFPDPAVARPFQDNLRLVDSDFFGMFEVPFRYGGPWTRDADTKPEQVVVLSAAMNDRLFGGRDSVGELLRIEDREFSVVGVLDGWLPSLRVYDMTQNPLIEPEPIFIPFGLSEPMNLRSAGNSDGWGGRAEEQTFIQYWVELPSAADVRAYRTYLETYIREQQQQGRFERPLNYRLSTISELMQDMQVAPKETQALLVVGLLFLVVASINLVGLLLGKFLARAAEVGVRRALGASRLDVFLQHLVECQLVALLGGAVGLGLTVMALRGLNAFFLDATARANVVRLDLTMLGVALLLSVIAGLIAGLYPAWRICRTPPAIHLKA
jgi:putative ABC transport system permease protein